MMVYHACVAVKRRLVNLMLVVVAMSLAVGSGTFTASAKSQYVIGHSMAGLGCTWWVIMNERVINLAKQYPEVHLVSTDAQSNSAKQIADVQDLLVRGIDLLLLFPNESAPLQVALQSAKKAGVPVIVWDKPMEGSDYLAFVTGDHYMIGRKNAEYLVQALTKKYGKPMGRIVEIEGEQGTLTTSLRRDGFDDVIKKYPDIRFVARQPGDFVRDKGYFVTKNILQAHPDVDAIYYHNDEMALGGIKAIEEAGKSGKIMVLGVDGQREMIKAIMDGKATVTQTYPYTLGDKALELGIKYLKGEKIPFKVIMPTYQITKENASEFYDPNFPAYVEPSKPAEPVVIWDRPDH